MQTCIQGGEIKPQILTNSVPQITLVQQHNNSGRTSLCLDNVQGGHRTRCSPLENPEGRREPVMMVSKDKINRPRAGSAMSNSSTRPRSRLCPIYTEASWSARSLLSIGHLKTQGHLSLGRSDRDKATIMPPHKTV